jgi:hypothetical protein
MGRFTNQVSEVYKMDKTGLIALIIGLVLCALGGIAIWAFLPEVIIAVKGLIGIAIFLVGIMLVIFGILIFKD